MKNFYKYLGTNRNCFYITLLVGILYSANSIIFPTFSGNLINSAIDDWAGSLPLLVTFIVLGIFQIFLSELNLHTMGKFKIKQKRIMRREIFRGISWKDFANQEERATYVSFINNDTPLIVEEYFAGTIDMVNCICLVLFSAISLVSIHWVLAFIILGMSVVIMIVPVKLRNHGAKARSMYSHALSRYNAGLQSYLGGLHIMNVYGYASRAAMLLEKENENVGEKESKVLERQLVVQGVTAFLQVTKTVLIVIVGMLLVVGQKMNVGNLVAVMQLSEIISSPVEVLAYLYHCRNEVSPLLKQYEKITTPILEENKNEETPVFQRIDVEGLSYQNEDLVILNNITVRFEAGKNYLICGESGSGKTTFLKLLAGIGVKQHSGTIKYNNVKQDEWNREAFYSMVCPVFQEPYLFYASLEENILLGRNVSKENYLEVIRKLNLKYLLERYEQQEISAEIVESLSGGERQRIALARAMVGQPQIYLLDEVTSSLDQENAQLIEKILLEDKAAIIHVCHKPDQNLSQYYQQKYVMEKGHLSFQGMPDLI